MDIGSTSWLRDIDYITEKMGESLSLEGTVLAQRANELQADALKLARQRAFLREERRRARMEEELLRQETADLNLTDNDEFVPARCLPDPDEKRIRLNVGGQTFESSETVLRRDPTSLLAALCEDAGPLKVDGDGTAYVDRDWWTFRFILKFLRDGVLPSDATLLTQLYLEAGYWRCGSLKRAIEEQMHLFRSTFELDASGTTRRRPREEKVDSPATAVAEEVDTTQKTGDWWTGSEYNGRRYNETPAVAEVAEALQRDGVKFATATTWSTGVRDVCPRCTW